MEREVGTWIVPFLFLFFSPLRWISANFEGDALNVFKQTVSDDPNGVLQSWDPTLPDPCSWFHVTCDLENNVTRVDLGNAQLSGSMVPDFSKLKKLQSLELYSNNINGSIPTEFGNLTSLVSLDLYNNRLTGHIPEKLGKMQKLRFLRINNNSLDGCIPTSLTTIQPLKVFYENNLGLCGSFTGKPCSGSPCP